MKRLFSLVMTLAAVLVSFVSPGFALATAGGFGSMTPNVTERGAAFLAEIMTGSKQHLQSKLGQKVIDAYKGGRLSMYGSNYYFRKGFSTTDYQFIKGTEERENGITNLIKGKLPADEVIILTGVSLGWAQAASSGNKEADQVVYSPQVFDLITNQALGTLDTDAGATGDQLNLVGIQRIDTAIINSEFVFKCGSDVIMKGNYSDFFKANFTGVEGDGLGFCELKAEKILTGDQLFEWITNVSKNASWTGSTDFFLEIKFHGIVLSPHAN